MQDILDGTSQTAMAGEKYMPTSEYNTGLSFGDDQPLFIGDDADNRRWTDMPPMHDMQLDDIQHFGSPHTAGCHFVLCDGSIRTISYTIDPKIFQGFGNRRDGAVIDLGQ
jgi:hypothetical protein